MKKNNKKNSTNAHQLCYWVYNNVNYYI